jgi:hypothetical protein
MLAKGSTGDSNQDAVADLVARLSQPVPAEVGDSED